jgi:hypothetical protein
VVLANLLNTGLDPLPGVNVAFLLSLVATLALTFLVLPYGKRRAVGAPLSWGEAMVASVYAFGVMFLAYGIVPHQWLTHADNELSWRSDVIVYGPLNILQPQALGGFFPFTITASHVKDIIATLIYVVLFGLQIWVWAWWQKRGKTKSAEIAVSSYGRPLVRKA